ncbi:efflux RND transporter periplasmic adaptor subunit [Aestuariivivens marinum]|uniref:efflux RND transporter periplasmic adaptor subunit n=1 Tax=Aestuariivivens marinum TaxID=2913555 RepID=UPI001F56D64C|nr:efflux RND transporter periplasmic adaptor subunit [Aestuariivivens marinum]
MIKKGNTYIALIFIVLLIVSCGNKTDHSENDVHSHDKDKQSVKGEMHHEEEVILNAQQFKELKMRIDTLSLRSIGDYVEANGSLEVPPQNEAAITTVVGANVTAIKVIEGDKVNKGQIVAYLSHPSIIALQTDYLKAFSNSEFLKKNFERQKKLYDSGVGSGANFQKAEAEYKSSIAMVNGLAAQLNILNINATSVRNGIIDQQIGIQSPIEGYVQKVKVKTGQYVEPQTELFEIVNTHHVHADLMVFEKDVHKVKKRQKVVFSVQSVPDAELTAEIYSVSKTFEDNPKAVHVHAEIKNKSETLIPGMYIQGKIQTDSILTKALPESAIVKDNDKFYVFVVGKKGNAWTFKPIEVIIGKKDGKWIEVSFPKEQPLNSMFAFNNAYYLIAEMKKGEAEHTH